MIIRTANVIAIIWLGNSGIVGDGEAVAVTVGVGVGVAVGVAVGAGVGVGVGVSANVAVIVWDAWMLLKVYDDAAVTEEPSTVKEAME